MKAKKTQPTSGAYLVSWDQSAWRREHSERQLASGALTVRHVCPAWSWGRGEHRDCERAAA